VSLTLRRGQVLALLGSSGSGKSLTCAAALGVLPPGVRQTAGRLLLDGIPVHGEQLRGGPSPPLCRTRAAPLIRCIPWRPTRGKPAGRGPARG
jgi:ABC-type glutathione transport system ATPase component